jgi:hypothetical protein
MSQPSLVPRARPLAGPGQSPGLVSLHPVARAGTGHEVFADSTPETRYWSGRGSINERYSMAILSGHG